MTNIIATLAVILITNTNDMHVAMGFTAPLNVNTDQKLREVIIWEATKIIGVNPTNGQMFSLLVSSNVVYRH